MVTASTAAVSLLSTEVPMVREQAGGITKFKANIREDLLLLPSRYNYLPALGQPERQ